MKRTRKEEMLKPVEKVEVSDKHVKLRIVFFVLALVIGLGAIGYGIYALTNAPSGWQKIDASQSGLSCAGELEFYCNIKASNSKEMTNTAKNAYTQACVTAYDLFSAKSGEKNLFCLNSHPNETVVLNTTLYNALKRVCEVDARYLFLAPLYARYENIFFAGDDNEAKNFDPNVNAEERAFFDEMLAFINDSSHISLQFDVNDAVTLHVSQEYLKFAEENGIGVFADFFYMKNAFIVDMVVSELNRAGITDGVVSSVDGYARSLSAESSSVKTTLYDNVDGLPFACAQAELGGSFAAVNFHTFKIHAREYNYYAYSDGRIVTPYLDCASGKETAKLAFMYCYSANKTCAEVLLSALPTFTSNDVTQAAELKRRDIFSVYVEGKNVCYNQAELKMEVRKSDDDSLYVKKLV